MLNIMQEKRCLKRSRLGPPDVYPQDAKQKEDELTSTNVKHGFSSGQQVAEEFGSARNCTVTASKVGAYFNAILAKREELMTLPDSGRKKQQINPKDNFWPVTGRNSKVDMWFRDLAGNKALIFLAKKAPYFNKKEEIFTYLSDHQVSMQKAAWFIKLSSAYTVAVSEAKIKKRQMPDPATEWTGTLIKFMKELLPKLAEHYHQGNAPNALLGDSKLSPMQSSSGGAAATSTSMSSSSAAAGNVSLNSNPLTPSGIPAPLTSPASSIHSPAAVAAAAQQQHNSGGLNSNLMHNMGGNSNAAGSQDDCRTELRHWNYCTQLIKYLYEEALLDRHEFLNWILDLHDRMRSQPATDGLLKLFLPLTLQYMFDFVQSERLSRRLAYLVSKKLTHVIASAMEANEIAPGTNLQQLFAAATGNSPNTIETLLGEYLMCPHHRDIILQLSTILQIITIECPTALVWCGLGENRAPSALIGSALDQLQLPPSGLPMPVNCAASTFELQRQLEEAEAKIRIRSGHAEAKWCTEKWQNRNGNSNAKTLATLDALDTHCFERLDSQSSTSANNGANNLDALYGRVFPAFQTVRQELVRGEMKESRVAYDAETTDAPVVRILCEWAVSSQRWGEHRAMAVAWLLDKRQSEVMPNENGGGGGGGGSGADKDGDKDSLGSGNGGGGYVGVPIFQSILMRFLDHDAPVLTDEHAGSSHSSSSHSSHSSNSSTANAQNRAQFTNLVHLFGELIRHDVFSHDAYMCTLISRGDLLTAGYGGVGCSATVAASKSASAVSQRASPTHQQHQQTTNATATSTTTASMDDDMYPAVPFSNEFDDNVDDDLDKLLQNINREQMDAPDSRKRRTHRTANVAAAPVPTNRLFRGIFCMPNIFHCARTIRCRSTTAISGTFCSLASARNATRRSMRLRRCPKRFANCSRRSSASMWPRAVK